MESRLCKNCNQAFGFERATKKFCCSKCRNSFWVKTHPRVALTSIKKSKLKSTCVST